MALAARTSSAKASLRRALSCSPTAARQCVGQAAPTLLVHYQ